MRMVQNIVMESNVKDFQDFDRVYGRFLLERRQQKIQLSPGQDEIMRKRT
jgi:hypothetical protein